jgi:hypothetical protein
MCLSLARARENPERQLYYYRSGFELPRQTIFALAITVVLRKQRVLVDEIVLHVYFCAVLPVGVPAAWANKTLNAAKNTAKTIVTMCRASAALFRHNLGHLIHGVMRFAVLYSGVSLMPPKELNDVWHVLLEFCVFEMSH